MKNILLIFWLLSVPTLSCHHARAQDALMVRRSALRASAVSMPPVPNIGRWTFDEASGTTALDSISSNNGTLNNSPARITGGNANGALSFAGGSDTATWGAGVGNQTTGSFSASIWVKYTGTANSFPVVFGTLGASGALGPGWGFLVHSDQRTYFVMRDGSGNEADAYSTSLPVINDGNWHMVTGVCDRGANEISMYVDGALYGGSDISSIGSITTSQTLTINRSLGASGYTGGADDAMITGVAWTSAQVLALFNDQAR